MEIVVIAPFSDKEADGRSRHVGDVLEFADARAEELAGLGYVAPAVDEAAEKAVDEAALEEPNSKSTRAELAAYAAALGVEFAAGATKAEIRAAIEAR